MTYFSANSLTVMMISLWGLLSLISSMIACNNKTKIKLFTDKTIQKLFFVTKLSEMIKLSYQTYQDHIKSSDCSSIPWNPPMDMFPLNGFVLGA